MSLTALVTVQLTHQLTHAEYDLYYELGDTSAPFHMQAYTICRRSTVIGLVLKTYYSNNLSFFSRVEIFRTFLGSRLIRELLTLVTKGFFKEES